MKWLKNFDRLLEIQRNIVWPSVLGKEPAFLGEYQNKKHFFNSFVFSPH